MAEQDPPSLATEFRTQIRAEVAAISATPKFVRAPVMLRLLEFLVAETLAGRGDQLKAYAVAVDGLGRPTDFDAQADSYPRVQIGRLRKMLDAYYARDGSGAGMRLSIPQGGYRVTLEPQRNAGPAIEERPEPAIVERPPRWLVASVAIALLAGIAGAAMMLAPREEGAKLPTKAIVPPPMLELASIVAPHSDPGRRDALRATLLDALRRSGVVQLKARRRTGGNDPSPIAARYALAGDLSEGAKPTLFLRLWRLGPDRLVWSDRVTLSSDASDFGEALAPTLAALTQPFGVIATNERAERPGDLSPGYPCMLQYDLYRADRTAHRHAAVSRCVAGTLAQSANNAPALAASAMLALDEVAFRMPTSSRSEPATVRAMIFAKQAVRSDPFSAFASHALARSSLYSGICPAAVRSGLRAAALNPYDPTTLASIGSYLIHCEDPRGETLVRRAIALDPSTPAYLTSLVYLAIGRDDAATAREAAMQMEEPSAGNAVFHHLAIAVALAANRDIGGAAQAWQKVAAADPTVTRDPEGVFRRLRFAPAIREKSLAHLAAVGLIPSAQPAAPAREPQPRPKR